MKTMFSLTFILLILAACAALPQNNEQARTWMQQSDDVVRKEFTLTGVSARTAEQRLNSFVNKCLNKEVTHTGTNSSAWGNHQTSYTSAFRPKIEKKKDRTTVYLQRYAPKLNMVGTPEEGRYEFIADIMKSKKGIDIKAGRLKVIWTREVSLGNILEDFESWMKGKGQFCPTLN